MIVSIAERLHLRGGRFILRSLSWDLGCRCDGRAEARRRVALREDSVDEPCGPVILLRDEVKRKVSIVDAGQ